MTAIEELRGKPALDQGDVEKFLTSHRFPIVEGDSATFVYHGQADEVHLHHWVYGLPSEQALTRLPNTDLWYFMMELPEKSRIEYKLSVSHGDMHRLINDPLNPLLARDPFGANSVCQASGYVHPSWADPDPDSRRGIVEQMPFRSEIFGEMRPISVYLPARFRRRRQYPLLIAHDGHDYLKFSNLREVLDNLIHRLEIPQMIVVLTDSPRRLHEYAADPDHAKFVAEELLPAIEGRYPILPRPASRALMGASFGAVASLSTAWRYPDKFGRLLLQSGSFAFTDIGRNHQRGPAFDPVVDWVNEFRRNPGRPTERMYLSCGMYESLIYENRSMIPLLQHTGMDVKFVESRDGHNWINWRDRLREGLSWLFPGPLWMVYE